MPVATREVVDRTAAEYALFHWPLEFPAVFERGGFDVVVGNPPWERVKLQEKEFFAERSPAIANARNAAARKKMIAALEQTNPPLWREFQTALRHSDGESHILRNSGRYPLAGRGDINTYAVFGELMYLTIGLRGRQGVIVPTGIATDDTTKYLFGDLVERRALVSLYSFENEGFIFPAIHHATKFCLLTVSGSRQAQPADLVFFARKITDLADEERHFSLTADDFALLNPNTRTCPTFRSRRDAELAKAIYRRVPVLVDESDDDAGNRWGVMFLAMFHMANDSGLFLDEPGPDRLPLYEAKMIHQFDHRYGTYEGQTEAQANVGTLPPVSTECKKSPTCRPVPRYWMDADLIRRRLGAHARQKWMLGWRDVTSSVASRTMVASALPLVGCNHKLPLAFASGGVPAGLLLANFNSFAFDWTARQKLGGLGMTFFVLRQLPVLPPTAYDEVPAWADRSLGDIARRYVAELADTSEDLRPFAADLGWVGPPFIWAADRREVLCAELDAMFFHAYGLDRTDMERVLESFWVIRERDEKLHGTYRTRALILDAYDRMAILGRGVPFASRLNPPPGDARAAHAPGPGEPAGGWLPWSEVARPTDARRIQLGSPTVAEPRSWAERTSTRPQSDGRDMSRRSGQVMLAVSEPGASGAWLSETAVTANDLTLGMRLRHRTRGPGTLLSVKPTGRSAELLIRFDETGEAWMVFGLGLLEFQVD